MMSTTTLADEVLNELYQNQQHRSNYNRRGTNPSQGKKSLKTMRLAPIQQQSQSTESIARKQNSHRIPPLSSTDSNDHFKSPVLLPQNQFSPSPEERTRKAGTRVDDMHYLSHIKHRAAGLSGISPEKSTQKQPSQGNHPLNLRFEETEMEEEQMIKEKQQQSPPPHISYQSKHLENSHALNQKVEEMQFQLLQESNYLSSLMASVVQQYESLKNINQSMMLHRKEIGMKVSEINDNYIKLFEDMLQEVMKIQRMKFKSQTKLVEDYRLENEQVVQTYTIILQEKEKVEKELHELQQEKANIETYNLSILHQLKEINLQNENLQRNNNVLTIQNQQLHKLTDEVVLLNSLKQRVKQLEEIVDRKEEIILSLTQKYQSDISLKNEMIAKFQEEITYLKDVNEKNSVFKNLDKIPFQYPRAESSTQTEVTEDGFWDTSQGWILPISKTALARQRWRKAFSFARCTSCRGIGGYLLSVQSLLKKCMYGLNSSIEMLTGEEKIIIVSHDRYIKWRIPDELVIFLNNLPITVQAKKPKSLVWTIQHLYLILQYKFLSDEEDSRLHYVTQSLLDFMIEQYLRNTESRYLAELQIYELLISLKEYAIQHPLITLLTRSLSLLDGLQEGEKQLFLAELKRNEEALVRKKKKEYDHLSSRQRNKLHSQWKDQQQLPPAGVSSSIGNQSSQYYHSVITAVSGDNTSAAEHTEREFLITDFSLSKDILKIVLVARHCCLAQPYEGVYSAPIHRIYQDVHDSKHANIPTIQRILEYEKKFVKFSKSFWKQKEVTAGKTTGANDDEGFRLPRHVICDVNSGQYSHYIPLDRAIHVLHPFLAQLTANQIISIYRLIEDHTKCLSSDGSVHLPSGLNTFIRSTMRLFLYALTEHGEDIPTWERIRDLYHHPSDEISFQILQEYSIDPTSFQQPPSSTLSKQIPLKDASVKRSPAEPTIIEDSALLLASAPETGSGATGGGSVAEGAASIERVKLHEDLSKYVLVTNLDFFLTIIAELIRYQLLSIEDRLRKIFDEGDLNHDNVLSFDEFKAIVCNVKPDFPDRTILKMFREALTQGPENKDCIGPDSFVHICKEYHLFEILDLDELKESQLRVLWKGKDIPKHRSEEELPFPNPELQISELVPSVMTASPLPPVDEFLKSNVAIPYSNKDRILNLENSSPSSLKLEQNKLSSKNSQSQSTAAKKLVAQKQAATLELAATAAPSEPPPSLIIPTQSNSLRITPPQSQSSLVHPSPSGLILDPITIRTAKLNEPLSKESSTKMISILNQRKQQRMKESVNRLRSKDEA